ncbi:MAG: hypothetical protein H6Q94_522 [Nitrospirae bacterium]|nr:hypothetical protein [Nitrospirota bacterium]
MLQLFEPKGDFFIRRVYTENDGFDFLPFLQEFRRMLDMLCPGKVRNVNKTVYSFREPDKNPEISNALYLSGDLLPCLIALAYQFPGTGL